MAGLSLGDFEQYILEICANSRLVKSVAQIQAGVYWVALRAYLDEEMFIFSDFLREVEIYLSKP